MPAAESLGTLEVGQKKGAVVCDLSNTRSFSSHPLSILSVVKPGIGHAYGLVVGLGHGWPNLSKDLALIADWFDKHLGK